MALFGRNQLPHRSTLSRFLAALDQTSVEALRTLCYDTLASQGVRVANGNWFGDEARVFRLGFGLLSVSDLNTTLNALAMTLKQTRARGYLE